MGPTKISSETQIAVRAPIAIVFLCISLVILIWAGLLYDRKRSEDIALEQGRADVSNLAIAFRENITGIITAIDGLMVTIDADHANHPDDYSIPQLVKNSPLLKGLALQVSLVGPDGIVRASNLPIEGKIDVSGRPHFRYHPDPSAAQPDISAPVVGRVSGKWSVQVTRRLTGDNGRFDGVVVVSIDPFYLSKFFDQVSLGKNGNAVLVGRDGIVRAGYALKNQELGQDLSNSELFRNLQSANEGTYLAVGKLSGLQSAVGYESLQTYPLIVAVAEPTDDILATVRRQNGTNLVVGGIATIALMALSWLLVRDSKRRRQQELARFSNSLIQEQKVRLEAALNNMAQGLLMFDPDGSLVASNRRFAELFEVPWEQWNARASGMTVSQTMQFVHELNKIVTEKNTSEIIAAMNGTLNDHTARSVVIERTDGRVFDASMAPKPNGGFVVTFDDITERRSYDKRLSYMAHYDALNDLTNRSSFDESLNTTLDRAEDTGKRFAVLSIDLDHFKEANDTYGHTVGDGLLREFAGRMKTAAGEAFVARLGGDEFAVIGAEGEQPAGAAALAERLLATLADDLEVGGHRLKLGMSIGIAIYPIDGDDADTLMICADAALYRAKAETRGMAMFFEAEMSARLRERYSLEEDLRSAINHGELLLHYQPQMDMSGEAVGFEALARWQCPKRGMVPPGTFIPIAEESSLIISMGEWILREACREAASWPKPLTIAVNVSVVQFRHGNLSMLVHSILLETGLAPGRLELEITETVMVNDFSRAVSILNQLKSLGVRIAMDDFGTGVSSLSYLRSFRFDKIKIDRTFVCDLEQNHHSRSIVRAVIGLGRSLDLQILAEGVETEAQYAFLAQEGCEEVQGYLTGRPLPILDYAKLVGREVNGQHRYAVAN